jgi:3-hydroxyacyl-[acyl-carrier-protein] dehydratase
MRWLWIDRFVAFQRGQSARAVKLLSLAEDHFADHFPGYPVMPGTLIVEGLAQTGGILVGDALDFRDKVVLAKIQRALFHREMLAGECLTYDVSIVNMRPEAASVEGVVTVNGEKTVEAEIFFAFLDQSRSAQLFGGHNFVFSGELKNLVDRMLVTFRPATPEAPAP